MYIYDIIYNKIIVYLELVDIGVELMKKILIIIILNIIFLSGCSSQVLEKTIDAKDNEILEIEPIENISSSFDDRIQIKKMKENIINPNLSDDEKSKYLDKLVKSYESKLVIMTNKFYKNEYGEIYKINLNEELNRKNISQIEDRRTKQFFYTLADGFYKLKKDFNTSIDSYKYVILVDYNALADYVGDLDGETYDYIQLMGHLQNIQVLLENKNLDFESFVRMLNNIEDYMNEYEGTVYTKKFTEIYKNFAYTFFLDSSYEYFSFYDNDIKEEEVLKLELIINENKNRLIGKMAEDIIKIYSKDQNFYYNVENYLYYYKVLGVANNGLIEELKEYIDGSQRTYIKLKQLESKVVEEKINLDIVSTLNEMIKRYQLEGKYFFQSSSLAYGDENYISILYRTVIIEDGSYKEYVDTKTYELKTGLVINLDNILENYLRDYKDYLDQLISYRSKYSFLENQIGYSVGRNQKYYLNKDGIVLVFEDEKDGIVQYIHLYYEELGDIIHNQLLKKT